MPEDTHVRVLHRREEIPTSQRTQKPCALEFRRGLFERGNDIFPIWSGRPSNVKGEMGRCGRGMWIAMKGSFKCESEICSRIYLGIVVVHPCDRTFHRPEIRKATGGGGRGTMDCD